MKYKNVFTDDIVNIILINSKIVTYIKEEPQIIIEGKKEFVIKEFSKPLHVFQKCYNKVCFDSKIFSR
ncbi:MAG: hypothetical protein KAT68_00640 [Bacteroidales bacterium]|nr:hypothetical protein [Bacteroidales bacterium]